MNLPSSDLKSFEYRARELKRLGNSDADIRAVLTRAGAPPEQIDEVMASLSPRQKGAGMSACLIFAIVLAVVVLGAGIFLAFTLKPAAPSTDPQSPNSAGYALPLPESDLIPTGEGFDPTPAPTVVLPADAQAYFDVIWNLQGTPAEKAVQFQNARPPAGLENEHAQVAAAYVKFAEQDEKQKQMQKKVDAACNPNPREECNKLRIEFMPMGLEREQAYSELLDVWTKTCVTWRGYYMQIGARFPYLEGRCKYP